MFNFRSLIDALLLTVTALAISASLLVMMPSSEPAAEPFSIEDLKQLMHDRSQYYQESMVASYSCDDLTDQIGPAGLKVMEKVDDNGFVVGRTASKKKLFFLGSKQETHGCKIIALSILPDIERVFGIVASNGWNSEMNESTAFFDVDEDLLVQSYEKLSHSDEQTIEILKEFTKEVFQFRSSVLDLEAKPEKSSI